MISNVTKSVEPVVRGHDDLLMSVCYVLAIKEGISKRRRRIQRRANLEGIAKFCASLKDSSLTTLKCAACPQY